MKFLIQLILLNLLQVVTCIESIRNVESNQKNVHRTHMFSKLHKSNDKLSGNEEIMPQDKMSIHYSDSNNSKQKHTVNKSINNINFILKKADVKLISVKNLRKRHFIFVNIPYQRTFKDNYDNVDKRLKKVKSSNLSENQNVLENRKLNIGDHHVVKREAVEPLNDLSPGDQFKLPGLPPSSSAPQDPPVPTMTTSLVVPKEDSDAPPVAQNPPQISVDQESDPVAQTVESVAQDSIPVAQDSTSGALQSQNDTSLVSNTDVNVPVADSSSNLAGFVKHLDRNSGAPPAIPGPLPQQANIVPSEENPGVLPAAPNSPVDASQSQILNPDSDMNSEQVNPQGTGTAQFPNPVNPQEPPVNENRIPTITVSTTASNVKTVTNAPANELTTQSKNGVISKTSKSPKKPTRVTNNQQHTTVDKSLPIQKPTEKEVNPNVEALEERTSETECKGGRCISSNVPGSRFSDGTWAMGSMTFILVLLTMSVLYTGLWRKRNQFIYGFKSREDGTHQFYKTTVSDVLRRFNKTKKNEMIRLKRMFRKQYNRVPLTEGSDIEEDDSSV